MSARTVPSTAGARITACSPKHGIRVDRAAVDDRWYLSQALRGATTRITEAGHDVVVHVVPPSATAADLGLQVGMDLSVIGFDDHPPAAGVGLTRIRQRPDELGAAAADLLLSGIGRGPDPKQSRLMPTTLVHRASTGRLR
jgi:hypothetical protein